MWTNYAMNVIITFVICPESHESSFTVAHFWEHFFKIFAVPSFLIFLKTRSHIMTRCEGFPLFWFFLILYGDFKTRSKLTTRPLLARGWILRNYWCISDEIDICAPKNVFSKKSRANYEAVVVQIWPGSNRISRNLSFLWEVYRYLSKHKHLVVSALHMV